MIIPDFSASKVLVVGDVMLDTYWHGETHRISPEAPVPILCVNTEESRLGGAANVAVNVSALGVCTHLIGLTGDDPNADYIEKLLLAQHVVPLLQRVQSSKTISKLRIMSSNQHVLRIDTEDYFPDFDKSILENIFLSHLSKCDVVIISDYGKGSIRDCAGLIKTGHYAKKPIIVDPKGTDFTRYKGATIITPNREEFEAVVGRCSCDEEIEERGIALRNFLELEAILITRSEQGMSLLARGQRPLHLPTRAQQVFDVTGAGDTVIAVLGGAISAGIPLYDAVKLANYAAGITVSKLGTSIVSLQELESVFILDSNPGFNGIFDEDYLLTKFRTARAQGKRIVMTNGCFDILHPGHIHYLEKARLEGDILIVAVNDDASVRRLKGHERPINPLETRMRMLYSLKCVDGVIPFREDTPERLFSKLLPDVLVKGGDYSEDQVIGGSYIRAAGGQVKIIDFLNGFSTSNIIHKLKGAPPN